MSTLSNPHVKLISLLLIASLIGIVLTHPHATHSHEREATSSQHSHSHSHQQHDTADEPNHSEFTARLTGTSFIVSFAPLNIIPATNTYRTISFQIGDRVFPEYSKQYESLQSLTRVYLL